MISEQRNFTHAARRALFGKNEPPKVIPGAGESATRIPRRHTRVKVTMNLDGDVVDYFKSQAENGGIGYQQLINQTLREYIEGTRAECLAREVGELLLGDQSFLSHVASSLK